MMSKVSLHRCTTPCLLFVLFFAGLPALLCQVLEDRQVVKKMLLAPSIDKWSYGVRFTANSALKHCRAMSSSCDRCLSSCQNDNTATTAMRYGKAVRELLSELAVCEASTRTFSGNLPTWCKSDGKRFSVLPGTPVTKDQCDSVDKFACVKVWRELVSSEVASGNLRENSREDIVSKTAHAYTSLLEMVATETEKAATAEGKAKLYQREKNERLLEQATEHLRDVTEDKTVFADAVYRGLNAMIAENRRLDMLLSRNDVYSANTENMFVRRETVMRIPRILNYISSLQNKIHSRKASTNELLDDIKRTISDTASFQEKATNILYESTHAEGVDGTISVLDNDLLRLYRTLREKRRFLQSSNLELTASKHSLVVLIKQLISSISKEQRLVGCKSSNTVAI